MLVENQRHRDYQEAVEFFLEKAENYTVVAKDVATQGGSQGLSIREDSSYQRAESMLRTLLERFANGASMQPIFDAVNQLYTDSTNDPELRCVSLYRLDSADANDTGSGSNSSTPTRAALSRSQATS